MRYLITLLLFMITPGFANACGTYRDFGSIYLYTDIKKGMTEDERTKCRIAALGAMMCVSEGYLIEHRDSGALVAQVLAHASMSKDKRVLCMSQQLYKSFGKLRRKIKRKRNFNPSRYHEIGEYQFDILCRKEHMSGHQPFGVRTYGPGQKAAIRCANKLKTQ